VPVSIDLNIGVDSKVLLFTFLLSLATGLLFGLLPAWTAAWRRPANALKGEDILARPGRFWSLRNLLVVAQISMSLVLLCVTGLCLRSLRSASNINIGFRSSNVLAMSVDPRLHGYTPERTAQFLAEAQRRVAAIPGVASAAVTDSVPLNGGHRSDGFQPVGRKPVDVPSVDLFMATPGYFDTLGIHLIAGRDFSAAESTVVPIPTPGAANTTTPPAPPLAAVVNQNFADSFFPHENPVGQLVSSGGINFEIIGVTNNIKSRFLGEDTRPVLFRSLAQTIARDPSFSGYTVLARTSGDSASVASSVRSVLRDMDPALAVYNEETIESHMRDALFLPRLAGTLFAVFGGVGLLLASIGLYGVMNYTVSLRTREIGIRMALGAQARSVQNLFLRRGLLLTAIAFLIGLPVAFLVSKLFNSILYGIKPHDAFTYTAVPVLLALIAALAAFLPARRASRVDPASTLRSE
jgi:predicted permease